MISFVEETLEHVARCCLFVRIAAAGTPARHGMERVLALLGHERQQVTDQLTDGLRPFPILP
jgi:hypothetical protein